MPSYKQPHLCYTCRSLLNILSSHPEKVLSGVDQDADSPIGKIRERYQWDHSVLERGVKEDCFVCVRLWRKIFQEWRETTGEYGTVLELEPEFIYARLWWSSFAAKTATLYLGMRVRGQRFDTELHVVHVDCEFPTPDAVTLLR